ncbi:uncharacterized protein K444DRAFT_607996 [Hyaloscypha bicolor E]|uniref:Uncharacterized protein n=1 Tax=Hyaloscypha bicolor E TaxID=1095630 RepID=A0A2J6TR47_9HELO|nr:uncharacterized protein K444DRAFT_607996 [Hyaloscypha bicolor E]PMD65428.1 hypothetical protein K444DRAFT_607996 [Hyaloscypha bicolor E]
MVRSQVIIAIMKAEAERSKAFFQNLSANYAPEGEDDVPLAEPALLFGPNGGGYDDVLALTEDLNSAKYFDCGCSTEGEGLKMIPCGHTIHYSCFKS